jgi:hypothetical protein
VAPLGVRFTSCQIPTVVRRTVTIAPFTTPKQERTLAPDAVEGDEDRATQSTGRPTGERGDERRRLW